jgi:AraC-like DNA-binding protein
MESDTDVTPARAVIDFAMRSPNRVAYGTGRGSAFHFTTKPVQFAPGRPPKVPQVRAASLTNYAGVARFVGLDPLTMLRRAGIDPEALSDPDRMIPRRATAQLLDDSACQSGCESFGLLMAECRTLPDFGALSLLLMHQETARGVVEALVHYQGLLSGAHAVDLEERDGTAIIRTEFAGKIGSRQAIDLLMGTVCRTISEVVSGRWHPECVHFVRPAPPDLSIHRRIFQCDIIFDATFNGLVCSSESLDALNPAAESVMALHARRYLDMLVPDPADGSIGERARRAVYLMLPAGRGTLEQVADNLGLHPRMLQRQLEKEGQTFVTLLNAVRRELALRYLSSSAHNVTAIAHMTGYASPSSFTRWFCAEFGVAPAVWRAEERAEERPSPYGHA